MKKFVLLFALCVAFHCSGQLLWKVSGGDLPKPSYVLGTFHVAPENFIDKVPGLRQVLDSVDAIVVEVTEAEMTNPINMGISIQEMYAPADSTLDVLFSPQEYREVDSLLRQVTMCDTISLCSYNNFKPGVITQILANGIFSSLMGSDVELATPFDSALERRVKALGKPSYGLETFEYQCQLLNKPTLREQADELKETLLNYSDCVFQSARLAIAYFMQDIHQVASLAAESPSDLDALECAERNKAWVPKILKLARKHPVLVSVGAAHLAEPVAGLPYLLKGAGYTVEPVK
ncbi:MAG: TraB/GumN family protein [Sodaliphilus sp.]